MTLLLTLQHLLPGWAITYLLIHPVLPVTLATDAINSGVDTGFEICT